MHTKLTHTKPLISSQPSNYPLNPQGSFQFLSPSSATVGNQLRRGHCGDSRGRDHGDQNNSNAREGLGQHEVSKGMGTDFPFDETK